MRVETGGTPVGGGGRVGAGGRPDPGRHGPPPPTPPLANPGSATGEIVECCKQLVQINAKLPSVIPVRTGG